MGSPRQHQRYCDLILLAFVLVLPCSNFIGAKKVAELDPCYSMCCFYGQWPLNEVIALATAHYILKTAREVLAAALIYWAVGFFKRKENQDHFDLDINFSPFKLKV
jgi:hypothetical protein